MKIMHVITTIERGGAENQLQLLAQLQAAHGHSVQIMYLKGREDLEENFKINKIDVSRLLSGKNFLIQVLKLKLYLLKNQVDIIHAHLPQAELVVRYAINKKSKFIITRHFGGKFHPNLPLPMSSYLGRIASRKADFIIAISESVKRILLENKEIYNPKLIKVIYYGFSKEEFFKNSIGLQFNFRENGYNKFNVGCISRLSKEKDLETLLRAVNKLKENEFNLHLYVAGEGIEKNSLQNLSVKLGIENQITFLGKISNVANFLQNVDLLVLCSKFEGFGMVLLEAMATHTKIVAARNSGIEEVVGNSGAGKFFETSNFVDLSSKILFSLSTEDLAYEVEQNKQLNKFSSKRMFEEMEQIYKS